MAIYNLDVSGRLPANRINNEIINIVPAAADLTGPAAYVLPQFAPFFGGNDGSIEPVIYHNNSNTPMQRGVDYDFICQHMHAYRYIGKQIYGGIYFINRLISGTVRVSYNTLGDVYVQNNYQHIATYFNTYYQQQVINWDAVFGVPALLPPLQHPEPLSSLKGVDDIVSVLQQISWAVESSDVGPLSVALNNLSVALNAHTNSTNAHGVSKTSLGIDKVRNYDICFEPGHEFGSGVDTRSLITGNMLHWNIAKRALFSIAGDSEEFESVNPMITNAPIFRASTLAGITLPDGRMMPTNPMLFVVQIKTPESSAQRYVQPVISPRVQFGILVGSDTNSYLVTRQLPANPTNGTSPALVQWNVFANAI